MKSDEARGQPATWLRAQRKAPRPGFPAGWKEAETVRRLEAAVPGVSFGAYRDIEAGNRPLTPDQRRAIEAVFGAIPDFTRAGDAGGSAPAALIQALADQTVAINRLADQVKALVERQATPDATAHLVSEAVVGALRVVLPDVLRDARLPQP